MSDRMENEMNGKQVGSFGWPFFRYDVIMPKQIKADLLVWLYLSLFVYKNKESKRPLTEYSDLVQSEVLRVMREKFVAMIDEDIAAKIVENAEKDFLVTKTDLNKGISKCLKEDTLTFLETYQDLFSEQTQIYRVYQDALTGGILPCYDDLSEIPECKEGSCPRIVPQTRNKPAKKSIMRSYYYSQKLKKTNIDQDSILNNVFQFEDPDAEVDFFADDPTQSPFQPGEKGEILFDDSNVLILDNSRCEFCFEIPVFVEENRLFIGSPFPEGTAKWLNHRFGLAINGGKCLDLADYISQIKKNTIAPSDNQITSMKKKSSISEQLKYFGNLYREIEKTSNNDLKKITIEMDEYAQSRHDFYFNRIGFFLECLIDPLRPTNRQSRPGYSLETFRNQIECAGSSAHVDITRLTYNDIYENWKKGYKHLKADIADIVISNPLFPRQTLLYPGVINDICDLYDLRNAKSHYDKTAVADFDHIVDQIDKLIKITKIFVGLY